MLTGMGRSVFLGVSYVLHPGPAHPNFLRPSTYIHTILPRLAKFTMVTHVGKDMFLWMNHATNVWQFGVAVTRWSRSTQLLYIEPG